MRCARRVRERSIAMRRRDDDESVGKRDGCIIVMILVA